MICPNCRREMGSKLVCDFCGFAFRVPQAKSAPSPLPENKPEAEPLEVSETVEVYKPVEFFATDEFFEPIEEEEAPHAPVPSYLRGTAPNTAVQPSLDEDDETEEPLSIGSYVGMMLVALIPLVSLITCIIWACTSKSENRTHFAVAVLILKAIFIMFALGAIAGYLLLNGSWLMFWLM